MPHKKGHHEEKAFLMTDLPEKRESRKSTRILFIIIVVSFILTVLFFWAVRSNDPDVNSQIGQKGGLVGMVIKSLSR